MIECLILFLIIGLFGALIMFVHSLETDNDSLLIVSVMLGFVCIFSLICLSLECGPDFNCSIDELEPTTVTEITLNNPQDCLNGNTCTVKMTTKEVEEIPQCKVIEGHKYCRE